MDFKKLFYLSQIFFLVCFSCSSLSAQEYRIETKNVQQLYQFLGWKPNQKPLISAHRGGPVNNFPENCIATFAHTLSISPALIECDIMMTKDSIAVIMHDKTLDRTSNGKGKITEYIWASLDTLKLKNNQGKITEYEIPTLEEVLQWAKGRTILKLDVKKNFPASKLVSLIRKHQVEASVVIITYNNEDALLYHQLAPDLMLSISPRNIEEVKELFDAGIKPQKLIAFVGVDSCDVELVNFLHQKGISCILGTMRQIDAEALSSGYKAYIPFLTEQKIDVLATDQPKLAEEAIQSMENTDNKRKKYIKYQ